MSLTFCASINNNYDFSGQDPRLSPFIYFACVLIFTRLLKIEPHHYHFPKEVYIQTLNWNSAKIFWMEGKHEKCRNCLDISAQCTLLSQQHLDHVRNRWRLNWPHTTLFNKTENGFNCMTANSWINNLKEVPFQNWSKSERKKNLKSKNKLIELRGTLGSRSQKWCFDLFLKDKKNDKLIVKYLFIFHF